MEPPKLNVRYAEDASDMQTGTDVALTETAAANDAEPSSTAVRST